MPYGQNFHSKPLNNEKNEKMKWRAKEGLEKEGAKKNYRSGNALNAKWMVAEQQKALEK